MNDTEKLNAIVGLINESLGISQCMVKYHSYIPACEREGYIRLLREQCRLFVEMLDIFTENDEKMQKKLQLLRKRC